MTKKNDRRKTDFDSPVIRSLDSTPAKYLSPLCPLNLQEQKELFLKYGVAPSFVFNSVEKVENVVKKQKGIIRTTLFKEAETIVEITRKKYGNGDAFLNAAYGPVIDEQMATSLVLNYMRDNHVEGTIKVLFTKDLSSSARMMWHGPNIKLNKPEARKYTMFIKNASDNNYMRLKGIKCVSDHEIGTHFFRMMNDGLQPWFSDRKKFNLRPLKSAALCTTEEGLAAINTVLNANLQYLRGPALLYYTACKAKQMNFRELFDHLAIYVLNPDLRWRHVMRVKRGLANPNDLGGYGGDQCYFEGAVEILRDLDNIDFNLLYAGKVCVDELNRVRRVARLDCIRLPRFLKDVEKYKRSLRKIAILNKLILPKQKVPRPLANACSSTKQRRNSSNMSQLDTCFMIEHEEPPVEYLQNKKTTSISTSSEECEYMKDPDSGFIYPDSSAKCYTPSYSSSSYASSTSLMIPRPPSATSDQIKRSSKPKKLLKRVKSTPNKIKKSPSGRHSYHRAEKSSKRNK